MNDAQAEPAYGRTNWRLFAIAVAVPAAAAGLMGAGVANGALPAQFAVSGDTFKISAERLEGTGFSQYGSEVQEKNGRKHPVAVAGIAKAKLTKLCQSVKVPNVPVSVVITAGDKDKKAEATNLLISMTELGGDAVFTNMDIGQDASTLKSGGPEAKGEAGGFGQQADAVTINDLRQISWATSAGSFSLTNLSLKVNVDPGGKPKECF